VQLECSDDLPLHIADYLAAQQNLTREKHVTECKLQVVDPNELQSIVTVGPQPALLAVAAKYGNVRLIDNVMLESHSIPKE